MPSSPRADPVAEAARLIELAGQRALDLHLVGGVAIAIAAAGASLPLPRAFKDIDLVTRKGQARAVKALMLDCGYAPDEQFNAMNGGRRLLFWDEAQSRQVDVFIGLFEMCHTIPILERARRGDPTIPLAELLLTKLQIVELNEKDAVDVLNLLATHNVSAATGAPSDIDGARVAQLCARDWGLWRTSMQNLKVVADVGGAARVSDVHRQRISRGVEQLLQLLGTVPKSLRWKARALIGERLKWYEEPEEVR